FISQQRLQLIKTNFKDILTYKPQILNFFAEHLPDLILLDLGVSSPQLDVSERGFSFYNEGPLDMRMDLQQELTAATIINEWSEQELSDLFYQLGEIRFPNKVVRAIAAKRREHPITTTMELSELIQRTDGWRKKGKHPATQYFLALRLRVNNELENIQDSIETMVDLLSPGGWLMIISFHSVEDRIVKNLFKSFKPLGKNLTKKVIQAERLEIKNNPRARSAKLRIFQKNLISEDNTDE
ncbi:MAG: 16S rRNA (cytosine(1402)-N(4))-methyltransferase RsmH, partial [Bdellovibrionales bacterium]|nr:16S rRNA (cytosine(1402)-N(4))-methyltransferase RsmH [Bdellovibrionales bacterium]